MVGAEGKILKITFPRMAKNAFFTVLFKHLDFQNNAIFAVPFRQITDSVEARLVSPDSLF